MPDYLSADKRSHTVRLRIPWFGIIRNPTSRQEEQRHQSSAANLWIVVRAGSRRGPTSTLPPLHTFQLGGLVDLNHAVDLSIGVRVVLARILLLGLHPHGRDTKKLGTLRRSEHPRPAVLLAVELRIGDPPFVDALTDQSAEVFVVGIAGAVVFVEKSL